MNNKVAMAELSELMIQKLKDEVQFWQEKAIAALEANDEKGCRKALRAQSQGIDTLIKMAETASRQFSQTN